MILVAERLVCRVRSSRYEVLLNRPSRSNHLFPFTRYPFLRFACLLSSSVAFALLVLACGHPPPGRGAGEVESSFATGSAGTALVFGLRR